MIRARLLVPLAAVGILAGCGSDNTADACGEFTSAYAAQREVVSSGGTQDEYEAANARLGQALADGVVATEGSLNTGFALAREGWQKDKDAGGLTDEAALGEVFQGYETLKTMCESQ